MAYLHCIPAMTVSEPLGADPHKGLPGFSRSRQNTSLAIVDLSMESSDNIPRRKYQSSSQSHRGNGFPPSTPSLKAQMRRRKSQATDEVRSASSNRKPTKTIPAPEVRGSMDSPTNKPSARSRIEKVYRPTLPKYCFSASTYQNVLTDYASSSDYGLVGDISQLPPPRHTLMTRELPYVYRFKIQQGITSLNKMIPTKRLQTSDNIW
ncbi:uncharacterized protein [Watersipora subatra]|uniref:uncharacterized protein n=1 Tax=Watersipora subatra TaxID=2589382 RepID=UPI00355C140B